MTSVLLSKCYERDLGRVKLAIRNATDDPVRDVQVELCIPAKAARAIYDDDIPETRDPATWGLADSSDGSPVWFTRVRDQQLMKSAFDLWSYEDAREPAGRDPGDIASWGHPGDGHRPSDRVGLGALRSTDRPWRA